MWFQKKIWFSLKFSSYWNYLFIWISNHVSWVLSRNWLFVLFLLFSVENFLIILQCHVFALELIYLTTDSCRCKTLFGAKLFITNLQTHIWKTRQTRWEFKHVYWLYCWMLCEKDVMESRVRLKCEKETNVIEKSAECHWKIIIIKFKRSFF